jgi:hypothetical protein
VSTAYMLVEVTYAGTVIRLSTDAIDITDAAEGVTYSYWPGLEALTVSTALGFLQSSAGMLSVPVQTTLPVSVAVLHAAGHQLARSPAEISIWTAGTDYAERIILARGVVSDPEWGEPAEPVAFSVEDAATVNPSTVPSSTEQVDGWTWPDSVLTLATEDLGVVYPRVYGHPGYIGGWVAGSQGVWASYIDGPQGYQLIVAGHAVDTPYIRLTTDQQTTPVQFRVVQVQDARGQIVSLVPYYADYPADTLSDYVDADGQHVYGLRATPEATAYQPSTDAPIQVYATWYDPVDVTRGGLSPLAGDVIIDMLRLSGMSIDYGRMAAAAGLLTSYQFDCVVDSRVKPLDWLQAQLLPLLPVSVDRSGDGASLIVWRYDATYDDVTAALDADADPLIERATPISADSRDIANRWTLRYRYSVRTGQYTDSVHRGNATLIVDGATQRAEPDAYCIASQSRYGIIERTIDTACVYDETTAGAILAWMARAYAFPRRTVSYVVPSAYKLTKGQIVTLTDSKVTISEQLCIVSDLQIDGTGTDAVTLLMVEDPQRDAKIG